MKKLIFILSLFVGVNSFAQTINNNQRIFNVKMFGAKGDGVTNDTRAIQATINSCNSAGGGTVWFPNGIYIIGDTIYASSSKSQLYIPVSLGTSVLRNHITLMGETKPNFIPIGGGLVGGAASTLPTGTVVLKSTLTTFTTAGQAVIGTALAGIAGVYNETFLSVENIAIQVKNNPAGGGPVIGGISYKNGGGLPDVRNVTVYIDTSGYRSTLPTNDIVGIETPDQSAETFNGLTNTLVVGFRTGYKLGEHVVLSQAQSMCCFYAFNMKAGFHSTASLRCAAFWCAYDLYVSGSCTLTNFQMDTEWQQIGKWYDDVATIKDTANLAKGQFFYTIVAAGVGLDNTKFIKTGGTNLNCDANAVGLASLDVNSFTGDQTYTKATGSLTMTYNEVATAASINQFFQRNGTNKWKIQMDNAAANYADFGIYDMVNGGVPRFYADVTAGVVGIGGTNAGAAATAGVYVDGSKNVTFDNSLFSYKATTHRLGIGIATPLAPLHVKSAFGASYGQLALQDVTAAGNQSIVYESYYDNANTRLMVMGLGHYASSTDPNYYFANEIAAGGIIFRNSSSNIFTITNSGSTRIGDATAPTDMLEVTGNLKLTTAGNKIKITTGTNASVGTATLSSGTVTVSTTAVTASSKIFLTDATTGALTNVGSPTVGTIVAGTSFVINSTNVLDASAVNWWIIN